MDEKNIMETQLKQKSSKTKPVWILTALFALAGAVISLAIDKYGFTLLFAALACFLVAIVLEIRWFRTNLITARNQIRSVGNVRWQAKEISAAVSNNKNEIERARSELATVEEELRHVSSKIGDMRKEISTLPKSIPAPVNIELSQKRRLVKTINTLLEKTTDGNIGILADDDGANHIYEANPRLKDFSYLMRPQQSLPHRLAHGTAGVIIDIDKIPSQYISETDYFYWIWLRHTAPIIAFSSSDSLSQLDMDKFSLYSNNLLTVLNEFEDFVVLGRRIPTGLEIQQN